MLMPVMEESPGDHYPSNFHLDLFYLCEHVACMIVSHLSVSMHGCELLWKDTPPLRKKLWKLLGGLR